MADWKFQAVMVEAGLETLENPALNKKFVAQARQFLEASTNKEASYTKLQELDQELVDLFNELHEVTYEEDEEKVQAIKLNQELQQSLDENQAELTRYKEELQELAEIRLKLQERETENESLKTELEETRKKVPPPPSDDQVKRRDRMLKIFEQAITENKSIRQTDLLDLGVPPEKFKAFFSFEFEGYTFERPIFGTTWSVSK